MFLSLRCRIGYHLLSAIEPESKAGPISGPARSLAGIMDELIIVIIVLGLVLVLLLGIGDLVGTAAFGLLILVLGWAYRVTERPKEEKQGEEN
jgi:hypothetical protein